MKYVLLLAVLTCACDKTVVILPTSPSTQTNTTTSSNNPVPNPNIRQNKIEYRVIGNIYNVRIRYSSGNDGLNQVVTVLPYTSSFSLSDSTIFVSLDATPINSYVLQQYPFMSVTIFVNGILFKEATSNDNFSTLSVSGTWRVTD